MTLILVGLQLVLAAAVLQAESGYDAWLRYTAKYNQPLPAVVATTDDSILTGSAREELIRGVRGMTGKTLRIESGVPKESAIVLSVRDKLPREWNLGVSLEPDGYWLKTLTSAGVRYTVITAANDRGVLYGAFAFLRKMSLGESVAQLDERHSPATPVRWVNNCLPKQTGFCLKPGLTKKAASSPRPLWACPQCGGPTILIGRLTAMELRLRSPPVPAVQ